LTKHYESGTELSQKILKGVNILADNVASTLGPRGRNVILKRNDARPIITKDGVTVAMFVDLDDPIENAGAQIVKQAAAKTANTAGDGTTTATVLAREILNQSQRYILAGSSPVELKRGIDKAVEAIADKLKEMARPIMSVEDIEHIATISANGDERIGNIISMAVDQVGKDGAITVEEARSLQTSLELVEGFQFKSGYVSPSFITDQRRGMVEYDKPYLLITDYKVDTIDELLPVLELVSREARPLVIIAEEISGQALAALIMNTTRGTLKVAAVKAPRYGEERRNTLKDLSLATGGCFFTRESGRNLSDIKLVDFGQAKKINIIKNHTTIVGGKGNHEKIEEKIEALKTEIQQTENLHECEMLQDRITRLASGIAIIRVGAATEIEMVEKRHRIEDALEAVKSAQEEGIVPGGGVALIRAIEDLDVVTSNRDQELGVEIIKQSVQAPLRQMAANAGESPDMIVSMLSGETGSRGYNFVTREVEDMYEIGVIDPVKVTRSAIQNAASVSSTLITTNYAIVQE